MNEKKLFEAQLQCRRNIDREVYNNKNRDIKRSDWWDEEMRDLVNEKRRLFEIQLQSRRDVDKEAYNSMKRDVKRKGREKQKRADERYGEKLSRNFIENTKMFLEGMSVLSEKLRINWI